LLLIFYHGLDYIFTISSHLPHHQKALNGVICADVPLRNYSLTHSLTRHFTSHLQYHCLSSAVVWRWTLQALLSLMAFLCRCAWELTVAVLSAS